MKPNNNYLIFIIIGICISVLFILVILKYSLSTKVQKTPVPLPTPTPISIQDVVQKVKSPSLQTIPTIGQDQGGGIDTKSNLVEKSTAAIKKLTPHLPFNSDVTLTTNLPVTILIPEESLQSNPWTLTAQIFGIDYDITPNDKNYPLMKASFQEAAGIVFAWIASNGVNASDVLVQWGDRTSIQQAAENFLKK